MITIERVSNGWVVDYGEDDGKDCFPTDDEEKYKIILLSALGDVLGLLGSRHDERRLVIRESHGDKFECQKEGCELCRN